MFESWEGDGQPVTYLDLNTAGAIPTLAEQYASPGLTVLNEVITHAQDAGAQTAVIEYRYLDADYRDEHAKFWSTTFRRFPSVAHRLHFFRNPIGEVATDVEPFHFEKFDYVGYAVMRPIPTAPVGRTMLPLPERPDGPTVVLCETTDYVSLMGSHLTVRGAPFYSQDAQLTRCGQAAMLSTGYYYHLAFGEPRMLPGDIANAAGANSGEFGRSTPSPGITLNQLLETATALRVPPVLYPVASLRSTEEVICRYLNSKFPVTVFTQRHAFLLVGYRIDVEDDGTHSVWFLRHDDEVGPYKWVHLREVDEYGAWQYLVVPLPPKVYLVAERAEALGLAQFKDTLKLGSADDRQLLKRLDAGELVLRCSAVTSNDFKRTLRDRNYPDPLIVEYQMMRMSRFIWVVELTDKTARDCGDQCVRAEVIIDATDHPHAPRILAWRIPSGLGWSVIDSNDVTFESNFAHGEPVHSVITHISPQRPAQVSTAAEAQETAAI